MSEATKETAQTTRSLNGLGQCPKCGSEKQVWRNQITNKITCHRYGCHVVIPNAKNEGLDAPERTQDEN